MDVFAIAGLLIFLATIYFLCVKPLNYWKYKGVPQHHFLITWREIILHFMSYRAITDAMQKMYNDFPGCRYAGLYRFFQPILSLRDPELIKQITVKDFDHFVDHSQFVPENTEPLWEKNLFSLKGDKWRDMRATLSPSFTSSKMKGMFGLISECAEQFVRYFEEQKSEVVEVEMKDVFTRITNDVIASTAFGVNCDSLRDRNNDFYLMGKQITDFKGLWRMVQFFIIVAAPSLAKFFGIKMFNPAQSSYFTKLVKENMETRKREGIVRPDMIHLLMEAQKERSKDVESKEQTNKRKKDELSEIDITAQALIFFFAGFDTVSTLMCFMAHELAVNEDIQRRLQEEIDETLRDCGERPVSYEDVSKMKYMDMVISESLRKWPGTVPVDRVCVQPYTIEPVHEGESPVHLKVGDLIWVPAFGLHRDPEYYPEPDRFDPERFNEENKGNRVPYTFLAFGVGPRSCIGNRFALIEIKLLFFHLLSKFDITVIKRTTVPLKIANNPMQLSAKGGFWLGLKLRKNN